MWTGGRWCGVEWGHYDIARLFWGLTGRLCGVIVDTYRIVLGKIVWLFSCNLNDKYACLKNPV